MNLWNIKRYLINTDFTKKIQKNLQKNKTMQRQYAFWFLHTNVQKDTKRVITVINQDTSDSVIFEFKISEEKFTRMKLSVWTIWKNVKYFDGAKREKAHEDSILGQTFQEVRSCSTDIMKRLQWARCWYITSPGKICPKYTSFWGLSECMKSKLEVTHYRIRTLWLPTLMLKATLKTHSGKGISFHFWPVLNSALYLEHMTSPSL